MFAVLPLMALLAGPAVAGSTCEDWGEITPSDRDTYRGEFVTFRISDPACGDVDTCSWWTDGNQGDFLQTTGSPITWRAPSELEDCVTLDFRLWASCTDGNTTGFADVTVRCTHEQLESVQASRNAVVSGGGCNGPVPSDSSSAAGVLLLLPLLGLGRRKRD